MENQLENPGGNLTSLGNAEEAEVSEETEEVNPGPRLPSNIIKLCDEISQCRGVVNTLTTSVPTVINTETQAKLNRDFSGDRSRGTRGSFVTTSQTDKSGKVQHYQIKEYEGAFSLI